jgi:hypothetical protein
MRMASHSRQLLLPALVIACLGLSACAPAVPDSALGAGFDDPFGQQSRDAALETSGVRVPETVLPPPGGVPQAGVQSTLPGALPDSAEATAAETARILAETRTPTATTGSEASGTPNNPGISRENDFDVVAERETIESDAARIAENRAQYTVVAPQALPSRPGSTEPNIVAFALSTSHPVGTQLYARAGLNGAARAARNCADYTSPDQAQIDFLARGGPERDRRGLDPDGDGYACGWDPTPFRNAQQG